MRRVWGYVVCAALVLAPATRGDAALMTSGFRAVAVAHAQNPIGALAVAPDGRLFAAVQTTAQTSGATPGTTELRVYRSYTQSDGAVVDEGAVWATLDTVRSTQTDEGLLGFALAPDFATSKLLYVHLATTAENANQHVRVYHETAEGIGEYLGTVQEGLEPPTESGSRNGGAMAFGVDGCLFVGVGDSGNRWSAQVLTGSNAVGGTESGQLCTQVCLNGVDWPARSTANDGKPNYAGKMLRLAVEGPSPAQPAPAHTALAQPATFAGGFRNPIAAAVHPLTGQLYLADRGEAQRSTIAIADAASNAGWPCVESDTVAASASCLVGHTIDEVRAAHPAWRTPIVTHTGSSPPAVAGLTAYTGLAYPEVFYGDMFYVLRESAKLYRIDLTPPCFLPPPGGVAPLPFHDTTNDGDFTVTYDLDGDGEYDNRAFASLTAIVQGPDRFGQQVLYVAGRTGNGFTDDSMIFRIEYATTFVPYSGPIGRVADSCFSDGVYSGTDITPVSYHYENPFARPQCFATGGPCPGQPDGTLCGDDDPCNGIEVCRAGVCQHATPASDGTTCGTGDACHDAGVCQAGACATGAAKPDGTSCSDTDPCNGSETCVAGVCQPGGGPQPWSINTLRLKTNGGALTLAGTLRPAAALAPTTIDTVSLRLESATQPFAVVLDHPTTDAGWRGRGDTFRYVDRRGVTPITRLQGRARGSALQIAVQARGVASPPATDRYTRAQLVIGAQCFAADLTCSGDARTTRCR